MHGYPSLSKTSGLTTKAAGREVLLLSATSGVDVDVIARRFSLASSRYIVRESTNVKVCHCQVIISNCLFEETNEQSIFSKVFYN